MSDAAIRLGVKPSTAYYWVKGTATGALARTRSGKARLLDSPATFVRVVPSRAVDATIAVRVGGAEIQVRRDFDSDLLRAVVDALRGGEM